MARLLTVLLLLAAAIATGACGGGDDGDGGDTQPGPSAAAQPYPPRAAEPATAPPTEREPAGRVVQVGGPAEGLVADVETGLLAVALQDPAQLALVETASGTVRERVRLPAGPRHLELARPGGPVLVPAEEADELVQVALPGGEVTSTPTGDHPHDAAFLDGRSFTADEFGSTVTAIDDGRRVAQAPVDVQPGGIVAVGDQIGVVSVRAYTFELLDPQTLRGGGSQNAGLGPTHAAVDDAGRVWITDTRGDALIGFATRPRLKFIARVALEGSPYGIAVDNRRDRIWVTLTGRNELVELDAADSPRPQRRLPTVRQPNSVAVDERTGRVVVASATEDAVQLVDP
jgi:DNA-binding beta-propeller fold protein YncE